MSRSVAAIAVLLAPASGWAQNAPPLDPYRQDQIRSEPLPDQTLPPDPPLGDVKAKSNDASNINAADTRSPIAPALPDPAAADDSVDALLSAARMAVSANRTGQAQEALERAESRLLDRDVDPSAANDPSEGGQIEAIETARQALAVGNPAAAEAAIDQAAIPQAAIPQAAIP